MARSVYFAFDYEDVRSFRANVVRNSWVMNKYKFRDSSIWEESKEKSIRKIKDLIDNCLVGTSVTCVLTGSGTYARRFVRYEIVKSIAMKKGLLSVGINWIKDKQGNTKFWPGNNPFEYLKLEISNDGSMINFFEYTNEWVVFKDLPRIKNNHFKEGFGKTFRFDELFFNYSYEWNNGKDNLVSWIEKAASQMGR
ncbi:MAG: TIR domain-containing protein [Flavobacteriales bacterium]